MDRRDRIQAKVLKNVLIDPDTGCWVWQGRDSGSGRGGGYARMELDGQTVAVHRVMYTNRYGYVPSKKQIDHKCENRRCVNPEHLEMVTHLQNQRRKKSRPAGATVGMAPTSSARSAESSSKSSASWPSTPAETTPTERAH